ncbi:right-handed parallel beta-helix repeat-containing protein [Cerasicoccus maritimus]|uniref:right-handed parallel beta-helix repeat-containing protein n=1 Tax=Cerasicoccus maritimus TaxID=490089 RepID=UPI002852B80D|nr:right-handed parallel beta-helix repeat-containing protein [Cerasicoccus maritimus]
MFDLPLAARQCCAALLLLSGAQLCATTYYVKNGGDDALSGLDDANAWASITRVNAASLSPGDTVLFNSGDVFADATLLPDSGNASNPVTYSAYGSGVKPVLTTAIELPISGWTDLGGDVYQIALPDETCMVVGDGVYFPPANSVATLADGTYYWDSAGYLYVQDSAGSPNISGKVFRVGQRDNVIKFQGEDFVVIEGLRLEIANNSLCIFNSGSSDNTISNCEFYYASSDNVTAGSGVHACSAPRLKVYDSRFSYLEGDGIYMQRADGYEAIGNEIDYLFDVGGDPGGDGIQISGKAGYESNDFRIKNNIVRRETKVTNKGCIIVEQGSGGVVSGNYVYQGRFGIACYSSNVVIEYNYCEDIGQYGGIRLWENKGQHDITIRYNIIDHADNAGITIGNTANPSTDMANIIIRNNVVYNSYYGVGISVPVSGEFKNNIVWAPRYNKPKFRLKVTGIIAGETFEADNNILEDSNVDGTEIIASWLGTDYTDLASYRSGSGQGANSSSDDPLWVDPDNNDFALQSNSPAIDAGEDPATATLDFYGNSAPVGDAIDVGAAEAGGLFTYEGFDYSTGTITTATGGFGWSGGWTFVGGAGVTMIRTSTDWPHALTYTDLPMAGNRFNIYDTDGVHQTAERSLAQTLGSTTGTYWFSVLVRKHSSGRSFTMDLDGLSLYCAAGDWQVKTPNGSYQTLTGASYSAEHFFVIRVDPGASVDTVYVWVDPVLSAGEPSTASADLTLTDTPFTIDSILLKQGPWGNGFQSTSIDELHFSNTFAGVIQVP